MGHNRKVFGEAVSEMKHFLLGSALVLTLVAVVPVLAQDGGMPPPPPPPSDGGGMPPPPPPPSGDMGGAAGMPNPGFIPNGAPADSSGAGMYSQTGQPAQPGQPGQPGQGCGNGSGVPCPPNGQPGQPGQPGQGGKLFCQSLGRESTPAECDLEDAKLGKKPGDMNLGQPGDMGKGKINQPQPPMDNKNKGKGDENSRFGLPETPARDMEEGKKPGFRFGEEEDKPSKGRPSFSRPEVEAPVEFDLPEVDFGDLESDSSVDAVEALSEQVLSPVLDVVEEGTVKSKKAVKSLVTKVNQSLKTAQKQVCSAFEDAVDQKDCNKAFKKAQSQLTKLGKKKNLKAAHLENLTDIVDGLDEALKDIAGIETEIDEEFEE